MRRERGGGIGGRTAGNATAADASVAMTARFTSATRASPASPAADTTRERVTRLDLCFVARVETSPEGFFAARADGFAEGMMADIFGVRGLVRKSVGACAVRMEDAREHWRANTQRPKPTKR